MCHFNKTSYFGLGIVACLVTWSAGCQQLRIPAFDPSGAKIFSSTDSMRLATPSDSRQKSTCMFPKPAWEQPLAPEPCPEPPPPPPPGVRVPKRAPSKAPPKARTKGVPGKITLTPKRIIAPVGSEVVIVGGLCGEDGYLITQQPIEFMLSQDSVGQFVEVSDRNSLWHRSKKLSADYAIARTSTKAQVITRGTPSVTDDIMQRKGQCWISITSASEGTSYVTAVANKGANWPQRRQSASIYWVDAQWAFPNPIAVPAGRPHNLSTSVTRTATSAPVVGYIVRYEIVDGNPAVFGPSGATAFELRTNDEGLANVVLQPTTNHPGVTQIRIRVIRPADPNSDAPRTQLGEGYTSITWSAPGLALRATGAQVGTVGSTLVYRLEVHNPGDITTQNVVVNDVLPPSLKFISSNPSAQIFGNRAEWRLGDIPPKSVRVIEVNLRADAGGAVRYAFVAKSANGLQAEAFVDTQITRPALSLNVVGPQTAEVGQSVQYRIEVTNNGAQTLDKVTIGDRFDASLRNADGLASPIQKDLGRFDPGQTKVFHVTFIVQRAGQICHVLEVSAQGGQYAQSQACITATQPAVVPRPSLSVTKRVVAAEAQVGQTVQFSTQVTNTGNVALTNVRIAEVYDQAFMPKESTPGVDTAELASSGQLVWTIPQLQPGQTVERNVLCECRQPADAAMGRVTVSTAEGVTQEAQASVRIRPAAAAPSNVLPPTAEAPAPGQLLVDISEFRNPIKIGEDTKYVITIKNDRTVPDQDIVVTIELPPGLRLKGATGPTVPRNISPTGNVVRMNSIKEMRAGEVLAEPFRIDATGVAAGEQTLRVTVTSRLSPQGTKAHKVTTVLAQ